jgi:hypothetical protein
MVKNKKLSDRDIKIYMERLYPGDRKKLNVNFKNLQIFYKFASIPIVYNYINDQYTSFVRKKFTKVNPNFSIKLHQTMKNNESWALTVPYDCLWVNPYDEKVVGKNVKAWSPKVRYIEVTSALPQAGPGNWFNNVPGSGMFFDLKGLKILSGRNKLDVLLNLGQTPSDIAKKFPNLSWNGWGNTNWNKQKQYLLKTWGINTLDELIHQVAKNPRNIIQLEWISDCPEVDDWTYQLAKKQKYDIVHYYGAGYQGCFWANEFMFIPNYHFDEIVKSRIVTTERPCENKSNSYLQCEGPVYNQIALLVALSICILLILVASFLLYFR